MKSNRVAVLAAVVALLLAGGLADRSPRPAQSARTPNSSAALMPTAAPASATSSTWYCPGATATAGSAAAGTVAIANAGSRIASGTVTVITSEGSSRQVPVRVAARSVATVSLVQVAPAPFAGAVVDMDAGQVVAELVVVGSPRYFDVTPCASTMSDHWYFADGSTARDAALTLSLFNPFPDDAIADLSFSTDEGRVAPADFEGIVIPPRSLVVKNVGDHVRRREAVATQVSVRRGRLVAAQTMTRTAPGRAGLSVTLGAPSPGLVWYFPDGVVSEGAGERYSIANPGPREATVLVEVNLDEGAAEPFELRVPPHDRAGLDLKGESRIPKGVGHSTVVRSLNGVPVVAVRSVEATSPSRRTGRADTLGARRAATQWAFAAGGASPDADEYLVVQNVGTTPARVSVTGLAGRTLRIEGLDGLPVAPGRRLSVKLADHVQRSQLPVVVSSSVPVVVERTIYTTDRPGLSANLGIPLA